MEGESGRLLGGSHVLSPGLRLLPSVCILVLSFLAGFIGMNGHDLVT